MSMKIKEAMSIIEESGLLLERIKKYRTTSDERYFRDNSSAYDINSIRSKLWEIIKEEGIRDYVTGIDNSAENSSKQTIRIEFKGLGNFGKRLIWKLAKAVGAVDNTYHDTIIFDFEKVRIQSQSVRTFRKIFHEMLKDRFGVPDGGFAWQDFYDTPDQWLDNAKKNYDRLEEYVEEKQYGGIHDLNYKRYRQTIKDAQEATDSPDNVDKYVTNEYGFRKRIDEIYAKFRRFCRLFKREMERPRGNLAKPTEE